MIGAGAPLPVPRATGAANANTTQAPARGDDAPASASFAGALAASSPPGNDGMQTTASTPKPNTSPGQSGASLPGRAGEPRGSAAPSIDPLIDAALAPATTAHDAALAARDALAGSTLGVATANDGLDSEGLPVAPDATLSQQMFALLMGAPATPANAPTSHPATPAITGDAAVAPSTSSSTPLPLSALPVDAQAAQAAANDEAALSDLLARLPAAANLPTATTATAASSAFALATPAVAAQNLAAQALAAREDGDSAGRATLELADGSLQAVTAPQSATRPLTAQAVAATPLAMPARADDGFDDSLGARIAWMADQKLGHAEIRLNPEHVGRIDVRIQLDGNRLAAEFSSANADVRQALEASLPRLRDMLGQHGMQLGQADVGHRQSQGQSGQPAPAMSTPGNASDTTLVADTGSRAPAATTTYSRGLVDEYA